jgi:response regulator RpfG family c-di-GMP phosphodiesterase
MPDKIKVLYIDDEIINLELFKMIFRSQFNVVMALSGTEALNILNIDLDIQAVISDLTMPEMNGYQFLEEAQKIRRDLPYFILSGHHMNDEINQGEEKKRITGYFQKPLDKTTVINKVKQACGIL